MREVEGRGKEGDTVRNVIGMCFDYRTIGPSADTSHQRVAAYTDQPLYLSSEWDAAEFAIRDETDRLSVFNNLSGIK